MQLRLHGSLVLPPGKSESQRKAERLAHLAWEETGLTCGTLLPSAVEATAFPTLKSAEVQSPREESLRLLARPMCEDSALRSGGGSVIKCPTSLPISRTDIIIPLFSVIREEKISHIP